MCLSMTNLYSLHVRKRAGSAMQKGLEISIFGLSILFIHTFCMRVANALVRLFRRAGSLEPRLLAD